MADLSDAEYDAAIARGRQFRASAPHARAARYDAAAKRVVIDLDNGTTFSFPPALVEHLSDAAPDQLAQVELAADGYGLHWPALDEDVAVPALLDGVFGTAKWMDALVARGLLPAFKRAA